MMVEFEVLGRVRLRRADCDAASPGGLQGLLLAMLLAHANQPVSVDRLVEAMWGPSSDARAAHRLQMHVLRLRRTLGQDAEVAFGPGGYRLSLAPAALDAERFATLVDDARKAGSDEPARAVDLLREALSLWRGEAYEGIDVPELRTESRRLLELRLVAIEELYAAELRCGHHAVVANELPALMAEHPLRERLYELLMMSHAIAGRRADALGTYRHARSVLVEELGIEPGPALRELEAQVLNGEHVGGRDQPAKPATVPAPAQLPAHPGGFVGRRHELEQLDAILEESGDSGRIRTLTGSAGVGKTALALHWAHRVRENFPGGQLYADLRGFGPDDARTPAHVLAGFLRALGVDSPSLPEDLDERAALFRSQVAGRRMLILLDNAQDVSQVRPLLPGAACCATVVTSRVVLAGLEVQEGARQVGVSRMSDDEARHVVTHLLDHPLEADDVDRLVQACSHLPLALRIAAERIRTLGPAGLSGLITELTHEQGRLDLLDGGDDDTSVRGVFSWSYRALNVDSAWVFRCLGVVPAREVDTSALAAMANLRPGATRRVLDNLVRAHLVEVTGDDRYRLHDLLRSYAGELADESDLPQHQTAAFERLCHHYVTNTATALEQVMPEEMGSTVARGILDAEDLHRPFDDAAAATRWLETERENLILVAERAARTGQSADPITLSRLLQRYLDTKRLLDDAQRLHTAAVTAARSSGDLNAEARALGALGWLGIRRDQFVEAEQHLLAALDLHEKAADSRLTARALNALGAVFMYTGRIHEAIRYYERAITEYNKTDDPASCFPTANLGVLHHMLGSPREALTWLESSLRLGEQHGKRHSECSTLTNLAPVCRDLGELDLALDYARRGLTLARELGRTETEGMALTSLGAVHQRRGELEQARELHRRALVIAENVNSDHVMAVSRIGVAEVSQAAGDPEDARCHYLALRDLTADFWDLRAHVLIGLGESYRQLGDEARGVDAWQQALDIYEEVGHRGATPLRRKIARAQGAEPSPV